MVLMAECTHCGKSIEEPSACQNQICIDCCYKCFNFIMTCSTIDTIEHSMKKANVGRIKEVTPTIR
jgi:hypothetical protein